MKSRSQSFNQALSPKRTRTDMEHNLASPRSSSSSSSNINEAMQRVNILNTSFTSRLSGSSLDNDLNSLDQPPLDEERASQSEAGSEFSSNSVVSIATSAADEHVRLLISQYGTNIPNLETLFKTPLPPNKLTNHNLKEKNGETRIGQHFIFYHYPYDTNRLVMPNLINDDLSAMNATVTESKDRYKKEVREKVKKLSSLPKL